METFQVFTGYGYFQDLSGKVTARAVLQEGEHELPSGSVYVEVNSQADLDSIIITDDPVPSSTLRDNMIRSRMYKIAEDQLINEGKLQKKKLNG